MANYDNKLTEWFKQVDKEEEELKARKQTENGPPESKPRRDAKQPQQPTSLEPESPPREASSSRVATIETLRTVVNATDDTRSEPEPEQEPQAREQADAQPLREGVPDSHDTQDARDPRPSLFEDEDLPQVEDFLSFLSRPRERRSESAGEMPLLEMPQEPKEPEEPEKPAEPKPIFQAPAEPPAPPPLFQPPSQPAPAQPDLHIPADRGTLDKMEEGTGDPRPLSEFLKQEPEPEVEHPQAHAAEPQAVEQEQIVESRPEPVQKPQPVPGPARADVETNWDRMPHHLQTLFASAEEEVAQNSYKTFKESRGQLIQRLLDPIISLEEAARILNVCPTTVRRYTNRGVLKHIRTAGNQRRFRLSDVLTFMESGARKSTAAQ